MSSVPTMCDLSRQLEEQFNQLLFALCQLLKALTSALHPRAAPIGWNIGSLWLLMSPRILNSSRRSTQVHSQCSLGSLR